MQSDQPITSRPFQGGAVQLRSPRGGSTRLSLEELVSAVESRRVSPRVLIDEFSTEIRDRAMELCASISRMNRCVGECSANTVSLASCDRAYASALSVLTEKLVGGSLGSSLARQKVRHGSRFDPRYAVIGFIRTVRHEDVRRRWNKERGLLQRIQRADFLPGRQGYESIARSVAAVTAGACERGNISHDRLGAVRRLAEAMGLVHPPHGHAGGGMTEVIPGLEVTADQLVQILAVFYRDACDVGPAGDDTMPWLARVRRDIRRLSTNGPASSTFGLADDALDELIVEAWNILRAVLSVGSDAGTESYWDRYFGRAYCVSRIAESVSDTGWASDGDTPYLAG